MRPEKKEGSVMADLEPSIERAVIRVQFQVIKIVANTCAYRIPKHVL